MNNNNQQIDFLELLSLLSDVLQVLNYFENKKQNKKIDHINEEVDNFKIRFENIENKLDLILEKIGEKTNESNTSNY